MELREALESAMEEPKSEASSTPATEPAKQEVREEPKATEPAKQEVKEEPKAGEPAKQEVKEEPKAGEPAKQEVKEEPKAGEPTKPAIKPPASWKAGAKERWASLPPEVQEEVSRRERETTVAIQRNAEGAKFVEDFQRAIQPYQAIIAAEGAPSPMAAIQNMFQTVTTLRLGTPIQKADLVARLINVYGVDIQALDNILSGQASPEMKQQSQLDQLLQERLSPLERELQQYRQMFATQQQQTQTEAARAVEEFAAKNEFLDDPDIANDMADLLELAAKRGRQMSMQEAYDRAVQAHPTISKLVAQRKPSVPAQTVDADKIRNAASSVKGSPMGGGPPASPGSIREAIAAAMDRG